MNGYQVSFYTTLGRHIHGRPMKDWLMGLARELGIPGATVFAGLEGYGHDRRFHSAHFFELADEPILIMMVVSEEQKKDLFARLEREEMDLFYVVQPVQSGSAGARGATNKK
jgi:uncharacterized protein